MTKKVDLFTPEFEQSKEETRARYTFIDLFAGIGGFRLAASNEGGECVFSSEWDKDAQKTYFHNFGELPHGDITKEEVKQFIPKSFDLLCAGFPCQAFSIAGRRAGFEEARGTLFFEVAEIIQRHQPKVVLLENVKGLINHDKGKTLSVILTILREDLGYVVPEPQLLNARDFGLAQNRERIFIVAFRPDIAPSRFLYPEGIKTKVPFLAVKETQAVSAKYYLSTQYIETLRKHKERHTKRGNGFGYKIIPDTEVANAIVCGGMGRERNLVIDNRLKDYTPVTRIKGEVNKEGIRRMTPREWARLQGFPEDFSIVVSDSAAYKQFGNSVAVPVVQAVIKQILCTVNL